MDKDNKNEELILVGRLGKTRGVEGHLWITPLTDFPERFLDLEGILVGRRDAWELLKIESSQIVSDRPLIKFVGVNNREEAARMTNRDLAVSRDNLIKLEPGTHYVFDLIGCDVFDEANDRKLGEVIDVNRYPASDVYVVRTAEGKEVLYPAVKDLVLEIDTEAKRIVVRDTSLFEAPDKKTKK